MDDQVARDVIKRLDALIFISLNKNHGQQMQLKEQVRLLDSIGFRPVEIAATLGRTSTHISKELANLRKEKGGKKHGKRK